jgi:hypothetical protein
MGEAKRKIISLSIKAKRFFTLLKLINPKYEDWKILQMLRNRNLITINTQQMYDKYRSLFRQYYVKIEIPSEIKAKLIIKGDNNL